MCCNWLIYNAIGVERKEAGNRFTEVVRHFAAIIFNQALSKFQERVSDVEKLHSYAKGLGKFIEYIRELFTLLGQYFFFVGE